MAPIAQLTSSGGGLQPAGGPPTAADLPLTGPDACPRGIYVHVPFCRHKCHYCDFYSVVSTSDRHRAFAARLREEIGAAAPRLTRPVETVYFGGGTPTLLAADLWAGILAALAEHVPDGEEEITVEANPETVAEPLLAVLAAGGVNRISVGVQSFHARHLETLQRRHDPDAAARSVELARAAGIEDISLDLIFGIPGQSLDEWLGDLETALALEPAHLSCYGLTYEPGTPLAARVRAGSIRRLDEDLEAAMYEAAIDRLAQAGYEHYEISNWARSPLPPQPAVLAQRAVVAAGPRRRRPRRGVAVVQRGPTGRVSGRWGAPADHRRRAAGRRRAGGRGAHAGAAPRGGHAAGGG